MKIVPFMNEFTGRLSVRLFGSSEKKKKTDRAECLLFVYVGRPKKRRRFGETIWQTEKKTLKTNISQLLQKVSSSPTVGVCKGENPATRRCRAAARVFKRYSSSERWRDSMSNNRTGIDFLFVSKIIFALSLQKQKIKNTVKKQPFNNVWFAAHERVRLLCVGFPENDRRNVCYFATTAPTACEYFRNLRVKI